MPCYHPLAGWLAKDRNAKTRKRAVVFRAAEGFKDRQVNIPCGRCIGCRLEKARQWAARCMHEAQMHDSNVFVTLTYNDGHLAKLGNDGKGEITTLRPRDFTTFMKRLRKKYGKVRYFQCGEYGDQLGRPHHHVLLFGLDFPDKRRLLGNNHDEHPLYESDSLNELWPHGFASIGNVTTESAGYVARYALKKITGPPAAPHYQGRVPEYATMSRRPGIGLEWLKKYGGDIYPSDEMIVGGKRSKPPRFYDEKWRELARVAPAPEGASTTETPDENEKDKQTAQKKSKNENVNEKTIEKIKRQRIARMKGNENNTGARLLVREKVKEAQIKMLTRNLEDQTR